MSTTGHVTAAQARGGRPVGFTEGARPDLTRYAAWLSGDRIRLDLRGLAPQNEQDTIVVCEILVDALRQGNHQAQLLGPGDQDDDALAIVDGNRLGIQVVRALTHPAFWRQLSQEGEVTELLMTPEEAAGYLRKAIEHKTRIPLEQRTRLILALDAYRLPALTLAPVADRFLSEHREWAQALNFHAIYIVGPQSLFVARLDLPA